MPPPHPVPSVGAPSPQLAPPVGFCVFGSKRWGTLVGQALGSEGWKGVGAGQAWAAGLALELLAAVRLVTGTRRSGGSASLLPDVLL